MRIHSSNIMSGNKRGAWAPGIDALLGKLPWHGGEQDSSLRASLYGSVGTGLLGRFKRAQHVRHAVIAGRADADAQARHVLGAQACDN